MMLALLAAYALPRSIQAQGLDKHITYTTRAARAAVVVPELGKLAGLTLQTSPQTENEVLIVSVKDVALSEVLKRIGVVTDGDWKQEQGLMRLVANPTLRRKEERDKLAKDVAAIKKLIAKWQAKEKELATKPVKTSEKNEDGSSPAEEREDALKNATITGLLAGIDPAILAGITSSDRVVFSTDPTRTQQRFGPGAESVIENFIQKHNENLADRPAGTNDDLTGLSQSEIETLRAIKARETTKISSVAKVLLVVSDSLTEDSGGDGDDEIELVFYNAQGGILYTLDATTDPYGGDDGASDSHPAPAAGTPVPVAPVTRTQRPTRIRPETIEGYAEKIYNPLKFDPLSFFQTDDLMEYAAAKGKPFVADLPDNWEAVTLVTGKTSGPRAQFVETQITEGETLQKVEDAQFTVLKPHDPVASRALRLDRRALNDLLQASKAKGLPSLDDVAVFALRNTEGNILITVYLSSIIPGSLMIASGPSSWSMLRFYGRLDQAQKDALQNGPLSLSKLTVDQKADLSTILYSSPMPLVVVDAKHPSLDQEFAFDDSLPPMDYRVEPTEIAANGLPDQGVIELKIAEEPFAAKIETRPGMPAKYGRILAPNDMATLRYSRETSAKNSGKTTPDLGKMLLGSAQRLTFTIHIGPESVFHETLLDRRVLPGATEITEATLPADFENLVGERLAAIRKAMASAEDGEAPKKIHPR